jgi:hypothetical protein
VGPRQNSETPGSEALPKTLEWLFHPLRLNDLVLSDSAEKLNDISCVVVKDKHDDQQLWLAPDLNYAIVMRVLRTKTDDGYLTKTFRCRDFRQHASGMWFPWLVEMTVRQDSRGETQVRRAVEIGLTALGVNDQVPDSVFEFDPPQGTLTLGAHEDVVAFKPGGQELLDLWAAACVRLYPPSRSSGLWVWQVGLSVLVGLVILRIVWLEMRDTLFARLGENNRNG